MRSAGVLVLAYLVMPSASLAAPVCEVWVRPTIRKDGAFVPGHFRTCPDGIKRNNWSYPGNVNPHTGVVAPGDRPFEARSVFGDGAWSSLRDANPRRAQDAWDRFQLDLLTLRILGQMANDRRELELQQRELDLERRRFESEQRTAAIDRAVREVDRVIAALPYIRYLVRQDEYLLVQEYLKAHHLMARLDVRGSLVTLVTLNSRDRSPESTLFTIDRARQRRAMAQLASVVRGEQSEGELRPAWGEVLASEALMPYEASDALYTRLASLCRDRTRRAAEGRARRAEKDAADVMRILQP